MVKSVETVSGIRWVGRQTGPVKALPGFVKGKHTVPDAVNSATSAFLARLCADALTEEAEGFFARTRQTFGYKRREISLDLQPPTAVLETVDGRLEWSYALREEDPSQYELTRTLAGVQSATWLRSPGCAEVLAGQFSELTFSLAKGAPVERVIDAIEALEASPLRVDYPSDCRWCELTVADVEAEVRYDGRDLAMVFPRAGAPAELWDAFLRVRNAFRLTEDAVLAGFVG